MRNIKKANLSESTKEVVESHGCLTFEGIRDIKEYIFANNIYLMFSCILFIIAFLQSIGMVLLYFTSNKNNLRSSLKFSYVAIYTLIYLLFFCCVCDYSIHIFSILFPSSKCIGYYSFFIVLFASLHFPVGLCTLHLIGFI